MNVAIPPRPRIIPPKPPSKPKRLPKKGNPMTLVAAYRSMEGGILLCADREENDGVAKRSVNKIYPIKLLSCSFFLAGAGPSNAIAKANEELDNALTQAFANGTDVLREYKSIIQKTLEPVFDQFAGVLTEMSMNFLIVVVAHAPNVVPVLYRTDGSVMISESLYAAFGSGKLICDYFSDRLYVYPRLDKPNLMAVAAFIFREAHKSASGVGSDVDMIYMRPSPALGEREEFGSNLVKEIQDGIPPLSESIWEHWKAHANLPWWMS